MKLILKDRVFQGPPLQIVRAMQNIAFGVPDFTVPQYTVPQYIDWVVANASRLEGVALKVTGETDPNAPRTWSTRWCGPASLCAGSAHTWRRARARRAEQGVSSRGATEHFPLASRYGQGEWLSTNDLVVAGPPAPWPERRRAGTFSNDWAPGSGQWPERALAITESTAHSRYRGHMPPANCRNPEWPWGKALHHKQSIISPDRLAQHNLAVRAYIVNHERYCYANFMFGIYSGGWLSRRMWHRAESSKLTG